MVKVASMTLVSTRKSIAAGTARSNANRTRMVNTKRDPNAIGSDAVIFTKPWIMCQRLRLMLSSQALLRMES